MPHFIALRSRSQATQLSLRSFSLVHLWLWVHVGVFRSNHHFNWPHTVTPSFRPKAWYSFLTAIHVLILPLATAFLVFPSPFLTPLHILTSSLNNERNFRKHQIYLPTSNHFWRCLFTYMIALHVRFWALLTLARSPRAAAWARVSQESLAMNVCTLISSQLQFAQTDRRWMTF